jgi:hypothetical protein
MFYTSLTRLKHYTRVWGEAEFPALLARCKVTYFE